MHLLLLTIATFVLFIGISTPPATAGTLLRKEDAVTIGNQGIDDPSYIKPKLVNDNVNLNIDVTFKTKQRVEWEKTTNMEFLEGVVISACNEAYPDDMLRLSSAKVDKITEGPASRPKDGKYTNRDEDYWWTTASLRVKGSCRDCNPDAPDSAFVLKGPYHKQFEDTLFLLMEVDQEYSTIHDFTVTSKYISKVAIESSDFTETLSFDKKEK